MSESEPLKIFLADLTHDTVGLATEVFPLNIGFVAAFCHKHHCDAVDLTLFKYIDQLETAITTSPPDILALSNYPWCHNVGLEMFRILAERKPEAIRVMGGPNFPHGAEDQEAFLAERPEIDAYVYLDGEVPFSNIVDLVLKTGDLTKVRRALKTTPVPGCAQLSAEGAILVPPVPIRLKDLDEIPSPYLTGLLDKFFDGRLAPLMATNRGCPFQCTFCADGTQKVSKVNQFSAGRVAAEFRYIGQRVPNNTKSLFFADLNFGMYKRDAEICMELAKLQEEFGYPMHIDITTGKNSKRRIISVIQQLGSTVPLCLSVQSLDPGVQKNIKRDNIQIDEMLGLQPYIKDAGLSTVSELISCLPGETFESNLKGLCDLLDAGVDSVACHTLILVNGSEIATRESRKKWNLKTKFRIMPMDFTRLRNGRVAVEPEEVVIATDTMSFEDYIRVREAFFIVRMLSIEPSQGLVRFLGQYGVKSHQLLESILGAIEGKSPSFSPPPSVVSVFQDFAKATRDELWDSSDEIVAFFQDPSNYQELVDGAYGKNLLFAYTGQMISTSLPEWIDTIFAQGTTLVISAGASGADLRQMDNLHRFCRSMATAVLSPDRLEVIPEEWLKYNFGAWMADGNDAPLDDLAWPEPRLVRFVLTDKGSRQLEALFERFGRSPHGLAKILSRINFKTLWRRPSLADAPRFKNAEPGSPDTASPNP